MSSFVRRVQRQTVATKASPKFDAENKFIGWGHAPAREKFYLGRGKMLGVSNPKAKDRLARLAREARRAA